MLDGWGGREWRFGAAGGGVLQNGNAGPQVADLTEDRLAHTHQLLMGMRCVSPA